MRSKIMIGIVLVLIATAFASSFEQKTCIRFCTFQGDGLTTLTNNDKPNHYVRIESAADYIPDSFKTSISMDGSKIVEGSDFNITFSTDSINPNKKTWTFNFKKSGKSLSTGTYLFNTTFYNSRKTTDTQSYTYTYLIDRDAPSYTITLLENGKADRTSQKVIEIGSNATLVIRASDKDGGGQSDQIPDTVVASVEFSLDGQPPVKAALEANGEHKFFIPEPDEGNHTVEIAVRDNLSNSNQTSFSFFVRDLIPPSLKWNLADITKTEVVNIIGFANESKVKIKAIVHEQESNEGLSFSGNDSEGHGSLLIGSYSCSNIKKSRQGQDSLYISPETADKLSEIPELYLSIIGKDTDDFHNYHAILDRGFNDRLVLDQELLSFSGTPMPCRFNVYTQQYPPGWFRLPIKLLVEGENIVLITATDVSGNMAKGNSSTYWNGSRFNVYKDSIVLDTKKPVISEEYPADGATAANDTTVSAKINGTGSGIKNSTLSINGPCTLESSDLSKDFGTVTFEIKNTALCEGVYPNGNYNASFYAEDEAGNKAWKNWSFSINSLASGRPELNIPGKSRKLGEKWYTSEMDITIEAIFLGDVEINGFELSIGDTVTPITQTALTAKKFLFAAGTLDEGTYLLMLNATKLIPGGVYSIFYFSIIVDRSAPSITSLKLMKNEREDKTNDAVIDIGNNATLVIKAQDFDGGDGYDKVSDTGVSSVAYALDGGALTAITPEIDGSYKINFTEPEAKRYFVQIAVSDNLSNTNSTIFTFLVKDMNPPDLIWNLADITNKDTVNIIGFANESYVKVYGFTYYEEFDESREFSVEDSRGRGVEYIGSFTCREISETRGKDRIYISDSLYKMLQPYGFAYVSVNGHETPDFRNHKVTIGGIIRRYLEVANENLGYSLSSNCYIDIYNGEYPPGWFNLSVELIGPGINDVFMAANDSSGNIANSKGFINIYPIKDILAFPDNITLDMQEPDISEEYPANFDSIGNNKTIIKARLDGTGSEITDIVLDITGPCTINGLTKGNGLIFIDGIMQFEIAKNMKYCSGAYGDGEYNLELSVKDRAGNLQQKDWNFTINSLLADRPKLELTGISIRENDTWYTTEKRFSASLSFPSNTTVNSMKLIEDETPLSYGNTREFDQYSLTPLSDLNEGTYTLLVNASKRIGGSIPTTFKYPIVVDRTSPDIGNPSIPEKIEYNKDTAITVSANDRTRVQRVWISANGKEIDMEFTGKLYNTSSRFLIPPLGETSFGIVINAIDALGNAAYKDGTITFVDSTAPEIIIIEPANNFTKTSLNTIVARTDDPSQCEFSGVPNFENARGFSTSDGLTHKYIVDLSKTNPKWNETNQTYYTRCTNYFDKRSVLKVPLYVDVSNLRITNAYSVKGGLYEDSGNNIIIIETNKDSKCTYTDSFDQQPYNASSAYSTKHVHTQGFEDGEHTLEIKCVDKTGASSGESAFVKFKQNVQAGLEILEKGPSGMIRDLRPRLFVSVNKNATCSFDSKDAASSFMSVDERLSYVYYYDYLNDQKEGEHTVEVDCVYGLYGASDTIIFNINRTPPLTPILGIPDKKIFVKEELEIRGTVQEGVEKVIIYLNGNSAGELLVVNKTFNGKLNLSSYADGNHTLTIIAEWPSGEEFRSEPAIRQIVKDTTSTAPKLQAIPQATDAGTITLNGTSEPNSNIQIKITSGFAGMQWNECTAAGCVIEYTAADQDGHFSSEVELNAGQNVISAKSNDQLGNPLSEESNKLFVFYDIEPPQFSSLLPSPGDKGINGNNLVVSALIADNYAVDENSIHLKIDNQEPAFTKAYAQGKIEIRGALNLSIGRHNTSISAKDAVGNSNTVEWKFEVFVPVICLVNACDTDKGKWCAQGIWTEQEYCSHCGLADPVCEMGCDDGNCSIPSNQWCSDGAWAISDYCAHCGSLDSDCQSGCTQGTCDIEKNKWCDNNLWVEESYCLKCGAKDAQCGINPPQLAGFTVDSIPSISGEYFSRQNLQIGWRYTGKSNITNIRLNNTPVPEWKTKLVSPDSIGYSYQLQNLANDRSYAFSVESSNDGFASSRHSFVFSIDATAPTITLDDSLDTYTSNPTVKIFGTYTEKNLKQIAVNGMALDSSEIGKTTFGKNVILPAGKTNITGSIEDLAGSKDEDIVEIEIIGGELPLSIDALPDYTKESRITLRGKTLPGLAVKITLNNIRLSAASNPQGNFSMELTLKEGNNEIIVNATDAAERSTQIIRHIILDSTGPEIVERSPERNEKGNFGQIAIKLRDASGIDTASIELRVNDGIVTHTYEEKEQTIYYNIEGLPEMGYTITLSAKDVLENRMATSWSFTLNKQAPLINITYPTSKGFVGESYPDIILDIKDYDMVNEVSLTRGEQRVEMVKFSVFKYRVREKLALQEEYHLTVKASKNNNMAEAHRYFRVDLNSPVITIDDSRIPSPTNKWSLDIYGTFEEENLESISVNGIKVEPIDIFEHTYIARNIPLGISDTKITASIKDMVGRTGNYSTIAKVDRILPALTITNPPNSAASVVGNNKVDIIGTAEANSMLLINGIEQGILADGIIHLTYYGLVKGRNEINISVVDEAGNVNSELRAAYYDAEGPAITNIMPNKDNPQNKNTFAINANINDHSRISYVELLINDTPEFRYIVPSAELTSNQFRLEQAFTPSKNSSYTITITARDVFGNSNIAKETFIFDADIPSRPLFNLEGKIINSSQPNLIFTYEEEVNITSLNLSTITNSTSDLKTYSFIAANLLDGKHTLAIAASRLVGRQYSFPWVFDFTVDTHKPGISISNTVKALSSSLLITINGTCSDNLAKYENISIIIYEGGFPFTGVSCVNGMYSKDIIVGGAGVRTIYVVANDTAGNSNSASKQILVDTGEPFINIASITGGMIIKEGDVYRTNSGQATITGNVADQNNEKFEANLNGLSTPLTWDAGSGNFEATVSLQGNAGKEAANIVVLTATDKVGIESKKSISIIYDQAGPNITSFYPIHAYNLTPTIQIMLNENATSCSLKYKTGVGPTETYDMNTRNNKAYYLSLLVKLRNITESQEINISCVDMLSNINSKKYYIFVDTINPTILEHDLIYEHKLDFGSDSTGKSYLIKKLNSDGQYAPIALMVQPSEDARCRYYGSKVGNFAAYEYRLGKTALLSDNVIMLADNTIYDFNIVCEDRAGRASETKSIRATVNTSYPVNAPHISLISPWAIAGAVSNSWSLWFNGSIISYLDSQIDTSSLTILNITRILARDSQGRFSELVNVKNDGEFDFIIFANNTAGLSTTKSGSVLIDTTGPGACIRIGNNVTCIPSQGRAAAGIYDYDKDGLPDWFEYKYWSCITCANNNDDTDGDGYSNLQEYSYGRNPIDRLL